MSRTKRTSSSSHWKINFFSPWYGWKIAQWVLKCNTINESNNYLKRMIYDLLIILWLFPSPEVVLVRQKEDKQLLQCNRLRITSPSIYNMHNITKKSIKHIQHAYHAIYVVLIATYSKIKYLIIISTIEITNHNNKNDVV